MIFAFSSHFRPHSPQFDSEGNRHGNTSSFSSQDSEFNMDYFTSHQEQLLQMQREQQEQLLRHQTCDLNSSFTALDQSFSSQPTSRFTLDTASAKFAVSAVMNSTQVQQQQCATSTATINGASSIATTTINLLNGPINTVTDSKCLLNSINICQIFLLWSSWILETCTISLIYQDIFSMFWVNNVTFRKLRNCKYIDSIEFLIVVF